MKCFCKVICYLLLSTIKKKKKCTPFYSHSHILMVSLCFSSQDLSKWGIYELVSKLLVVELQHGGVPVEVRSLITTVSYREQPDSSESSVVFCVLLSDDH